MVIGCYQLLIILENVDGYHNHNPESTFNLWVDEGLRKYENFVCNFMLSLQEEIITLRVMNEKLPFQIY